MSHKRQIRELRQGEKLTIMVSAAQSELESMLTPVRIPLDKGLIGYRVLLIHKDAQPEFSEVRTLEDLRRFTVGQGAGWGDVKVWRANGFKVVEGTDYDGLFAMTAQRRFDCFSRGIVEVIDELEAYGERYPELRIEESILVYYPWPFYFYFPKSDVGRALAERVRQGLLEVFADNEVFEPLFMKYHGEALARHNLERRKVFVLNNPLLSPQTPLHDDRLWFDPRRDCPPGN